MNTQELKVRTDETPDEFNARCSAIMKQYWREFKDEGLPILYNGHVLWSKIDLMTEEQIDRLPQSERQCPLCTGQGDTAYTVEILHPEYPKGKVWTRCLCWRRVRKLRDETIPFRLISGYATELTEKDARMSNKAQKDGQTLIAKTTTRRGAA